MKIESIFELVKEKHRSRPMDLDWFGPHGMGSDSPKYAYLTVPGGKTKVRHQFNCVCCSQFEAENQNVYPIRDQFGKDLARMSGCHPDEEALRGIFGDSFRYVSEGLITLEDGYILTPNCD
jgi:hypothetical protein